MQGSEQLSLPYLILQLMSFWQLATLMENLRKSPEIEFLAFWFKSHLDIRDSEFKIH